MNGKKYEIKPLEWKKINDEHYSAKVGGKHYRIFMIGDTWEACLSRHDMQDISVGLNSLEEAKRDCELNHIESMEELLTEVKE